MSTPTRVATPGQATTYLRNLQYRVENTSQLVVATASFQSAWRLLGAASGELLDVDGIVGKYTTEALEEADKRRRENKTTCSAHFSFREFACQCGGKSPGCAGNLVIGAEVDAGEIIRKVAYSGPGDGLAIVSGYRCPARNTAVKGRSTKSLHQWGAAFDLDARLSTREMKDLGVAAGIGYNRAGKVKHVDFRGLATGRGKRVDSLRPPNPTGSTKATPAIFLDV